MELVVQGGNAGNIKIDAESIVISGLSGAFDPTFDDFTGIDASGGFLGGASGNIDIHSQNIELTNRAWIRSDVYGDLDGRDINIDSETLRITDGGILSASNNGTNQGGSIVINSSTVIVSGVNEEPDLLTEEYFPSTISAGTTNSGNAGDIYITAENLEVFDGAAILTPTVLGSGNGGNIEINSKNISVSGYNETIFNRRLENGIAEKFALEDARSTISSFSLFADFFGLGGAGGDAGNITLVGDNISITDNAWIMSRAVSATPSTTDSGDISITANRLSLENGGSINSSIGNAGHAGNVDIKANSINIIGHLSEIEKTGIFSSTVGNIAGQGGDISLESQFLRIENGAEINAETSGSGRGGDIDIVSRNLIVAGYNPETDTRSKISSSSVSTEDIEATGDSGNINIESDFIAVNESGHIFSGSTGTGVAGNIKVTDANRIYITSNGEISTRTLQADGGNISLDAKSLIYQDSGTVNTSVNGSIGDGGNIEIATNVYVLKNSHVIANAHEGSGGNISITTNRFILDANSVIDASSQLGFDGKININIRGGNENNTEKLPDSKEDVSSKFATLCSLDNNALSSLSISDTEPTNLGFNRLSVSEYSLPTGLLNIKLDEHKNNLNLTYSDNFIVKHLQTSVAKIDCETSTNNVH